MGWNARIPDLEYGEILEKGRFLEKDGAPGQWRIVRLDEALSIVKPVPELWLDFKDVETFSPEFAEQVVLSVKAAGIDLSRVMVATFNRRALGYFKDHYPSIRRVGHVYFGPAIGKSAMRANTLAFRDEYGLYGLNMPVKGRNTDLDDIAFLRKNGLWVSLWFVQDGETAAFYRAARPDAFVTDHVSLVRE